MCCLLGILVFGTNFRAQKCEKILGQWHLFLIQEFQILLLVPLDQF